MENFKHWYEYGFSGIIDDAARMERAEGLEYITNEVAKFVKCDPNFKSSEAAGNPAFIFNFALYLAGRMDERRQGDEWSDTELAEWDNPELAEWDGDPLPDWADGLYLRKQGTK